MKELLRRNHLIAGGIAAVVLALGLVVAAWPSVVRQDQWSLKAPNGLSFGLVRDYLDYKFVSAHYRADKKEMHVIFGNPTAMAAYAAGAGLNGKPFPDGATMVKIGYSLHENPAFPGSIEPDVLQRIEYITRDSVHFKDTGNWGYARFVYDPKAGTFSSYGKDKDFANECFACHKLVANRDFIFTAYTDR